MSGREALIAVPPSRRMAGFHHHGGVHYARAGTARGGWLEAQRPAAGGRGRGSAELEAVAASPGDGVAPPHWNHGDALSWRCRVCKSRFEPRAGEMTILQLRLRLSSGQLCSQSWPCDCVRLEAAGCRLALAYALLGSPADTAGFGLAADVVAAAGGSMRVTTAGVGAPLALQLRVLDRVLAPAYTLHSTHDAGLEHREQCFVKPPLFKCAPTV